MKLDPIAILKWFLSLLTTLLVAWILSYITDWRNDQKDQIKARSVQLNDIENMMRYLITQHYEDSLRYVRQTEQLKGQLATLIEDMEDEHRYHRAIRDKLGPQYKTLLSIPYPH
jgi:hypothetical protein